MRINDMIDAMNLRGDAWREEFTSLPEDEKLIEQAKVEKENRKNESSYLEKLYGKANGRENFLAYFGSDLNRITKSYGINPTWLLALIEKEGSGFNAFTKSTGSAVGLGQITDDTWTELTSKIIPADARAMELVGGSRLERYNPIHQMIAMCSYLEHIRVKKPTANWSDAAIYYHTGMNATDADVPKYLKWNPAIAREMKGEPTLANYVDAARRYYNLAGLE